MGSSYSSSEVILMSLTVELFDVPSPAETPPHNSLRVSVLLSVFVPVIS